MLNITSSKFKNQKILKILEVFNLVILKFTCKKVLENYHLYKNSSKNMILIMIKKSLFKNDFEKQK